MIRCQPARPVKPKDGIEHGCLGDDGHLTQFGKHLRDERRSAARHVKHKPVGGGGGAKLEKCVDGRLHPAQRLGREGGSPCPGLFEERLGEPSEAEVVPLDLQTALVFEHLHG